MSTNDDKIQTGFINWPIPSFDELKTTYSKSVFAGDHERYLIRPGYDADDRTGLFYKSEDLTTVLRDPESGDGNYDLIAREGAVPVDFKIAVSVVGDGDYESLLERDARRRARVIRKISENSICGAFGGADKRLYDQEVPSNG